ncbi:MAG: trypsin-like peptidase domain-containing protein [Nakamurella sp.]
MTDPPSSRATRDRPVLAPRPLHRPAVDPAARGTFGRPDGVGGSFSAADRMPTPLLPSAPPPSEMLVDAFGRPAGAPASLQREPTPPEVEAAPARDESDPWRTMDAVAVLGAPALRADEAPPVVPGPAVRYSLREALFQKRLRPSAMVGAVALLLLVGATGAVIGTLGASRIPAATLNPDFSLATAQPAVERQPGSVADIAARVIPSVVSIEIRVGDSGGSGSGIVIDQAGYILTNNHVASVATTPGAQMSVVFSDGTRVPSTIVARDIHSDLAVIKVDVDNLTVAQLGRSSQLQVGDAVIAIGSPLGLSGTVTTGIISAVNRPVHLSGEGSDTDAVIDALQTDAPINPGNSGGALVDASGAVIGINSAIRTLGNTSSGSIGLGFAIPIDYARDIADQLIRNGSAVHTTIGVDARSATDGTTLGAQVQNVRGGSPAEAAGIIEGDVVTKVGDRAVGSADELTVAVQSYPVGQNVAVELSRDGRAFTVQVTLAQE